MAKTASKYNLLVVAHPDDETIFFGGLLAKVRRLPWKVICVTDGNADGLGSLRKKQFASALERLRVKDFEQWNFQDRYESRLNTRMLVDRLRDLEQSAREVYTHGVIGEYGHPHHQDVSFAVHEAFARGRPVWSVAYNALPRRVIALGQAEYRLKTKILTDIYFSETQRFVRFLPATASEGFVRVDPNEVTALYEYFLSGKQPDLASLKTYRWYWPFLKDRAPKPYPRPF